MSVTLQRGQNNSNQHGNPSVSKGAHTCGCRSQKLHIQLDIKIQVLKEEDLCAKEIDQYRQDLSRLSDKELADVLKKTAESGLLKNYQITALSEAQQTYINAPTKENREVLEKVLAESLIEAKKTRIEKFNEAKRELIKHGTPEQMKEFLDIALKEGIITNAQYDRLCRRLQKEGVKASGEEFNQYLYELSVRVTQNLTTAKSQTYTAKNTSQHDSSTVVQSMHSTFIPERSQSNQTAILSPRLESHIRSYISLFELNASTATPKTIAEILIATGDAIREKIQEHKAETQRQDAAADQKEKERVHSILSKYPKLIGEIQTAFAELEKLPEYELIALAERLMAALHPASEKH